MSDKPLIQQALAADLADLILGINPKSEATGESAAHERDIAALGYLRGFWECICREWEGIDRLRYALSLAPAQMPMRAQRSHSEPRDQHDLMDRRDTGPRSPTLQS